MFLEAQLAEIESYIEKAHIENLRISKREIGWHLDHTLKVLINVPVALRKSDPTEFRSNFSLLRTFIYTFNYIPRGKGKAPKHVRSFDPISDEQLSDQLMQAKNALDSMSDLKPKHNFKHPYFGLLNLRQTKKFMYIHTEHHLKICRDILK